MKNSAQSQEHGHREPQEEDQRHLTPPHPTRDNDSGDLSPPLHEHQQYQLHNRIGNVGQRFLRHFDYAFLLDRSLHQFDNSHDTTNSASRLSPVAEAYLRHYYYQQYQHSQQGKEQQTGSFEVSPVLRRRTTVDGDGRRPEVLTGGLPPLLPLESLSPELHQGRGSSSPLADLRLDDVMVDAERLARSFVVVEGEGDDDDGKDEESEQQQVHGPRMPRQCSDPSIEQQHSGLQRGEVGDETNHARRKDNASNSPAAIATTNISGRWSAFSLWPLSYRSTTTTTIDESRNASFAATTAATTAASRSSATTTTAFVYRDSADNEQAAEEKGVDEQRYLAPERQRADDHVAILPSTSCTGDSDKTQGVRASRNYSRYSLTRKYVDIPTYLDPIDNQRCSLKEESFSSSPSSSSTRPHSATSVTTTDGNGNGNNNSVDDKTLIPFNNDNTTASLSAPRQESPLTMYHHHNQPQLRHLQQQQAQRNIPSFVSSVDTHHPQQQRTPADNSTAKQVSRMQRFTRLEDLADLEDLTVRLPATTSTDSSSMSRVTSAHSRNSHNSRPSGEHFPEEGHDEQEHEHHIEHSNGIRRSEQDERTRQYIEAHTTFLNSADTEGSGYIPPRPTVTGTFSLYQQQLQQQQHTQRFHDPLDEHSHASASASRTPVHYPSSLAEEEGYTAPGTPHSFLSSPSLGFYSHPSRPPSQTGYWLDQGASSLNLIMPSSAMFVKSREPTSEGEQLGFVKLMVAGQSRVWNSRLIQDMFRWEGVIANDFDDEFLQDPLPDSDSSGIATGSTTTAAASAVGGGASSNESGSFMEETPAGHHHQQRKREYAHQQGQGVREAVVEHYASSMVLPAWARAGFDDQELNQDILVKNICIVDTPGYSAFNNPNRAMDLVISYLGLQFQTTNEFFSRSALSDDSLGRFLANNTTGAHSHVDGCLYVIEGALSEIDIQFMQRLQSWVNLIPVLIPPQDATTGMGMGMGMGDSSGSELIASARVELIRQLKEHEIHIYGIDVGSISTGHLPPAMSTSSNSSPFTTAESPEAALASPPLLVLDDSNLLLSEFTTPPFVFHVPPSLVEDTGVGQLDRDVLKLDVVTKQEIDRQNDEDDSDNGGHSSLLPTVPQHRPSSAPGVQEYLPDLGPLRCWVYVHHLAALRHHTTQKFLSWRRHLPQMSLQSPMESSQDSGSYRQHHQQQQQRRYLHHQIQGHVGQQGNGHGQQSLNTFWSDSGPESYRPALSTATHSPPPSISVTQHNPNGQQQYHQRALPTDLLGDLRVHDQRRISDKVVRMLETHGQIFERILQERQVAWRQALEGMEREQRIEFLMQELRRWANEGPASEGSEAAAKQQQLQQGRSMEGWTGQGQQQKRRLDVQYRVREGSRDPEWSTGAGSGAGSTGVTVGLGLEGAMGVVEPLPSLRDALSEPSVGEVSNSVRSINAVNGHKSKSKSKHGSGGGGRDRCTKKSRSSKVPSSSKDTEMTDGLVEEYQEDPLGLGLWMSRMFGAIGRGLVQLVVMVGMGSFATWLYTHFLENRVTWIG